MGEIVRPSAANAAFLQGSGEMARRIREHDWSATPIGDPESWPLPLRTLLGVILGSNQPMFVAWGPERTLIYNNPYAEILAQKHPGALGRPFLEVWHEIRDDLIPIVEQAYRGQPVQMDDIMLMMERKGYPEEAHFAFSYTPVRDETGTIAGFFCACQEITGRVLAERQLRQSEERLRGVLHGMGEAFALMDRDFRLLAFNEAALQLETRPLEEILGRSHWEVYPGSENSELGRLYKRALAEQQPVALEHRYTWEDGTARWLEMRAYPVPEGLAVFWRDISERKDAEERVCAGEMRLRLAVEAGRIGEWELDVATDTSVRAFRHDQIFGYDEPIENWGFESFIGHVVPEDRPQVEAAFRHAAETGSGWHFECRIRRANDGEIRWIAAHSEPQLGPDGKVRRLFGLVQDITEERQAQEQLRQSEARLRFMSRLDEALRASRDAPEAMQAAAELLARHLGASRCAYADVDADNDRFVIRSDFTVPGLLSSAGTYSLDLFGSRAAADMRSGRTLVVRDVPGELAPDDGREMFLSIGISAIVCCPLVKDGQLVAMMAVHQVTPRDWQADEIDLVEAVVERCWGHVERVGAEARLRESEAQLTEERSALATLIEHLPVGVILVDRDGTTLLHNRAYARIVPEAAIPSRLPDAEEHWIGYDAEGQRIRREEFAGARALRGELSRNLEFLHRAPDGQETWTHVSGVPLRDAAGEVAGAICVVVDIDAQKRAEERLQLATEAAELGIFDVDFTTGAMDWDRRQRKLWRIGPNEGITDEIFLAGIHPDDLERVQATLAQALDPEGNGLYAAEYRLRPREDDDECWIAATGRVHFDGQRPVRLIGTVQDVTTRRRTEAALRRSEARLRELNETLEQQVAERTAERDRVWRLSRDLLVVVAADGTVRAVNPALRTILGYEPDELVGRSFREFPGLEDVSRSESTLSEVVSAEGLINFERRYRHKDGTPRWISWHTSVEGDLVYGYGRDITAEKEQQAELEQAQEALRQSQKMEAMGQLTGGVAHDFNNLLTPIIASLDMLLRRGVGSERERRLMDGALQSAERAKVLVQRLLAFARRQPLQPTAVDVKQLVSGMAELIASTSGPRIDVRVDLPDDLPPALADANQLEMAVLNLAVNARDAMPEGGVLTISASRESVRQPRHPAKLRPGHYARLSVADTGTGMDEATLSRAVEPFFSTKGVGRGTGLGLSMVHGLASQLGGGLAIASRPGEGTTVELWLPISAVAVEEDGPATQGPAAPRARGTALLVDDEDLVRLSTADMLMDLGYEVVEARSAEEALHRVEEGLEPDLVVTDHLMPGMSGLELARDLRSRRPDLPVLIVSGYAEMDGIAPGFARLTKPFRSAELAASLAALRSDGQK